ncbi:hypothetical protein TNCV_1788251 [Trichonephila clavipes]|nr:hypothetical protein TNCV_1788251 [Trichonephila clavipes]
MAIGVCLCLIETVCHFNECNNPSYENFASSHNTFPRSGSTAPSLSEKNKDPKFPLNCRPIFSSPASPNSLRKSSFSRIQAFSDSEPYHPRLPTRFTHTEKKRPPGVGSLNIGSPLHMQFCCLGLSREDLYDSPLLVIDFLRINNLMDLV